VLLLKILSQNCLGWIGEEVDRLCIYEVILKCVRVTIVTVGKQ